MNWIKRFVKSDDTQPARTVPFKDNPAVVRAVFVDAFAQMTDTIDRAKASGTDDMLLSSDSRFLHQKLAQSPALAEKFFDEPAVQARLTEEGLIFNKALGDAVLLAPAPDAPEGSLGARITNGIALRQAWQDEQLTLSS